MSIAYYRSHSDRDWLLIATDALESGAYPSEHGQWGLYRPGVAEGQKLNRLCMSDEVREMLSKNGYFLVKLPPE